MFTHYRSRAFILKKNDRGEADRLLTVYTENFGKLELLAKSIRKIKSKLRSGTEPFYLSEIEFIQGKSYKTLTDAILIDNFKNLRKDLIKLTIAYKISEVFSKLVQGQEPDKKLWQLLNETFQKLNNLSFIIYHLSLLYYYFLWNLFSLLGYQLELYYCLVCQKKLKQENFLLNLKEGGLVCCQCQSKVKFKKIIIPPETIKIIRIFLKKDWLTLRKLKVQPQDLDSLKLISNYYLSEVLKQTQ